MRAGLVLRPGPEARYETTEAISLVFITALQLLPPRQRAGSRRPARQPDTAAEHRLAARLTDAMERADR